MAFTNYDPNTSTPATLVNSLLTQVSGMALDSTSVLLHYGTVSGGNTSVSFYDGSLNLGIGAGLLFSTGDAVPPTSNTSSSYSGYLTDAGDTLDSADLKAVVDAAFTGAGSINDYNALQFTINVTDAAIKGVRFDVVFASDEYPEYSSSSYVDAAAVFVNGVNYALFNGSASQPLSVLDQNLSAGNFIDNAAGVLSIEYDGVSSKLQIVAPVQQGSNTIKIAIGDTGDSAYDSALFIANMAPANYTGSGLAEVIAIPGGTSAQPLSDSSGNQVYQFNGGKNTLNITGGDDIVEGGSGSTLVQLSYGVSGISGYTFDNGALTVQGTSGTTTMNNVSKVLLQDLAVALDTNAGEGTWNAMALVNAAFGGLSDNAVLSKWAAAADDAASITGLAQSIISFYAPGGVSDSDVVTILYQNIAGVAPSQDIVDSYVAQIGAGKQFASQADLFAYAATIEANTTGFADLVGTLVTLDLAYFA